MSQYPRHRRAGFTLIELLVVIAIIGILAALILSAVSVLRLRGQKSQVQSDMAQISKVILIAEGQTGKDLIAITPSGGWEAGAYGCTGRDLRNIPDTDSCYTGWIATLTAIQNASGNVTTSLTAFARDAWKSPYLMDENVHEGGPTDCRPDTLFSAGPDGTAYTSDDILINLPTDKPCQ